VPVCACESESSRKKERKKERDREHANCADEQCSFVSIHTSDGYLCVCERVRVREIMPTIPIEIMPNALRERRERLWRPQ